MSKSPTVVSKRTTLGGGTKEPIQNKERTRVRNLEVMRLPLKIVGGPQVRPTFKLIGRFKSVKKRARLSNSPLYARVLRSRSLEDFQKCPQPRRVGWPRRSRDQIAIHTRVIQARSRYIPRCPGQLQLRLHGRIRLATPATHHSCRHEDLQSMTNRRDRLFARCEVPNDLKHPLIEPQVLRRPAAGHHQRVVRYLASRRRTWHSTETDAPAFRCKFDVPRNRESPWRQNRLPSYPGKPHQRHAPPS